MDPNLNLLPWVLQMLLIGIFVVRSLSDMIYSLFKLRRLSAKERIQRPLKREERIRRRHTRMPL
jgi:hypothetical protein